MNHTTVECVHRIQDSGISKMEQLVAVSLKPNPLSFSAPHLLPPSTITLSVDKCLICLSSTILVPITQHFVCFFTHFIVG